MSRSLIHILGALCLVFGGNALADEAGAGRDAGRAEPDSSYPDAWSIRRYVASVRRFPAVGTSHRAPPAVSPTQTSMPAGMHRRMADDFGDRASLSERIRNLKKLRYARLWRGRDRDLVIGIQNGGYIGISLRKPEEDRP